MGNEFVGIVHPCKVYNIMSVGAPILYIGPEVSHITDLANANYPLFFTRHGDTTRVVAQILEARNCERQPLNAFSTHTLLPELIDILEEPKSVDIGHLPFDISHFSFSERNEARKLELELPAVAQTNDK